MTIKACVFDAYGTLFDVAGAARAAAADDARLAQAWPGLAEVWRLKQLEYSWLRAIADDYKPFAAVTADALDYALEAEGLDGDDALRARLLDLYMRLPAYPEVAETLAALRERGLHTAILSNGSPDMLSAAVESAGLGALLDAVLSVEAVGVFKPHARVYALAEAHFGLPAAAMGFFSSNGWDVTGASAHGYRAVWVNRRAAPLDRVGAPPLAVAPDLSAAARALLEA